MIGATAVRRRLPAGFLGLWDTTVGKKAVMAATGVILYAYVVLHMWGNWKVFTGASSLNDYAEWLRVVGEPLFPREGLLWIVRLILFAALVLHVVAAVQLKRRDLAGRPIHYRTRKDVQASFASRSMLWGGLAIFLFIIFHVLQLTTGTLQPIVSGRPFITGDVYSNFVAGFKVWWVDAIYVFAVAALGLHLYHGIWSAAQSLGLNDRQRNTFFRGLASISGFLLFAGNAVMPLAVLAGIVK